MVYATLSTLLHGDSEVPPAGECHLITDSLEADGNFLLHHYVSAFLRAATGSTSSSQPSVILISTSQIFSHYAAIGKKLGMNLVAAKAKGQLYFMDLLTRFTAMPAHADAATEEMSRPDIATYKLPTVPNCSLAWMPQTGTASTIDWEASLQQVITKLMELCRAGSNGSTARTAIIIDDVTALLFAGCPVQTLVAFVRAVRRLCDTHGVNLVILAHDDLTFESDVEHDLCLRMVARLPHVVLAVQGLDSGVSRDVHGQVTLMRGAARMDTARAATFHPRLLHYRLLENGAQFFAPGYAASVI
ncbi:hypothetical protein SYNPS1DRAFT_31944 [Syncephalis pseudoplumigaleata]|uniref:Elongator complex protein 6 n=1 Tax=Syncephalis pseudoplumigaleata TaxID=1712513 RepID=A0A4V1J0R3_9FUNG|nr:hypothetical protein SYNPS1DRAFT_31944 [Syncephalis pseudoplumigaleata]|eukprot:RKP22459.1 hypothetical protein SYNPS1DRAFT_31944 [Syncephalis pseudoplumigaleata]